MRGLSRAETSMSSDMDMVKGGSVFCSNSQSIRSAYMLDSPKITFDNVYIDEISYTFRHLVTYKYFSLSCFITTNATRIFSTHMNALKMSG